VDEFEDCYQPRSAHHLLKGVVDVNREGGFTFHGGARRNDTALGIPHLRRARQLRLASPSSSAAPADPSADRAHLPRTYVTSIFWR